MGEVLQTPGRPLDAATRSEFETRFAHDFDRVRVHAGDGDAQEREADEVAARVTALTLIESQTPSERDGVPPRNFSSIRIHTDARAAESARAVHALAYTVGKHIVFGANRFDSHSNVGRRLLAHELTHTLQQNAAPAFVARQCNPAWAGLPWNQRVRNAKRLAGSAGDQCVADMLDDALSQNVTVHNSTNSARNVTAAINAGRYVEWGTLADTHVNYDRNLNAKIGNTSDYGHATFITNPAAPNTIRIFIILGPKALGEHGPEVTQMAFDHESSHAWDYLRDFALKGSSPHSATSGEELAIYAEGFSLHFLDMWEINNTPPGSFQIVESFLPLFMYYHAATPAERDRAFNSIKMFYEVRIQGIACNEMKFKIWLQGMQNNHPASDPLVSRINALPGLGLTKGHNPSSHLNIQLRCS